MIKSCHALTVPLMFTYSGIFFTYLLLLSKFKALNGLLCANVSVRNY